MFILTLLFATAIAVVNMRNLLAAAMLTGIYSLLSACWMTVLDAPDVAYTEAAVGAGISTVLMLATLGLTSQEEKQSADIAPVPLFIAMITGTVLLYGTLEMPDFGDPNAPIHQHVAPHYLQTSQEEIAVPNIITAVLASYRGYDTFGETTVVFTAAVGVLALLRRRRDEDEVLR
jgi:multicomponent Na+:H+ antiporter subunit B